MAKTGPKPAAGEARNSFAAVRLTDGEIAQLRVLAGDKSVSELLRDLVLNYLFEARAALMAGTDHIEVLTELVTALDEAVWSSVSDEHTITPVQERLL